jgi:hypothetical protein
MNNGRHYCEYSDHNGKCFKIVDAQYKYCYGHKSLMQTKELLKGGELHASTNTREGISNSSGTLK